MRLKVAPLVGARIEIIFLLSLLGTLLVAPLVGARIEIRKSDIFLPMSESLPSWERGLKSHAFRSLRCSLQVAPLVGARIEI